MTAYVTSEDAPFVFGAYAAHVDRAATNVLGDAPQHPSSASGEQVEEPEAQVPTGVDQQLAQAWSSSPSV